VIRYADRRKTQDLPPLGRVETLSGGRLRVRSLRDPAVQALLDRARPGWQWEPMLVEVEEARVRVFGGLGMQARLVQILGPVRALRVAQAVARMGGPVLGVDWGRRDFLRRAGGALLGLLTLQGLGAPLRSGTARPPSLPNPGRPPADGCHGGNRSMKRSSTGPRPNSARSAGTPNPTGTKCGCILPSKVLLWSHHYRYPDHRIAS